jgi:hypothetical protein
MIWRTTPSGLIVPQQRNTWPRPAGWDKLPKDVQEAWDARWREVQAKEAAGK